MPDFNLVTVCTDAYPVAYLEKLVKRLREVSFMNFNAYCITDKPDQMPEGVTPIKPELNVSGWWNKMQVYDGATMPDGWVLYMDLDIVIIKEFDDVLRDIMEKGDEHKIHAVSDAIGWMDNKYSSSFMFLQPSRHRYIWKKFKKQYEKIVRHPGGDQVWVGKNMTPNVDYIDNQHPWFKMNLKFHLGTKKAGVYHFPSIIDSRIRMVDCGGKPKPHELSHLPYIYENWTTI
jgi:hypothetical protein